MPKILFGMGSVAIFLIGLAVQGTLCVPFGILHILPFGTNAIEFDADRVADLIKGFWRCIVILHKKVAINNKNRIASKPTDCWFDVIHR